MKKFTVLFLLCIAVVFSSLTANAQVTVSGSTGADGNYPSLSGFDGAFISINSNSQTGNNILITITGNTSENGGRELAEGTWTTLKIIPSGGQARTLSGSTDRMINLKGADNVTIDGLNTGGNSLTISNTSIVSGGAIYFENDACNNIITNCTILGSHQGFVGTINFGIRTLTGNIGNVISSCNIGAAGSNLPRFGIYSSTLSITEPNTVTVTNCNIYDYTAAGIDVSTGSTAWTITNNKFYQTSTRLYADQSTIGSNTISGITIETGNSYSITGNTIGFANSLGTGTTNIICNSVDLSGFPGSYTASGSSVSIKYIAIQCSFTSGGTSSNINNNTIAGFAMYASAGTGNTGTFGGISVINGADTVYIQNNTIGSTSGLSSIYAAGGSAKIVGIFNGGPGVISITGNTIGGCDASSSTATSSGQFTGINLTAGTNINVNYNTIGNSTADNIRTGYLLSGGNLSNAGTLTSATGSSTSVIGITNTASGTVRITTNTLQGFNIGATAATFSGITMTGGSVSTSCLVSGNFLGTSSAGLVRYAFANSGDLLGINITYNKTQSPLTVSNNDIRGIVNSAAATHAHTYIKCNHGPNNTTSVINGNTFTNLSVNTSGNVIMIFRIGDMNSTGAYQIINNSIITGYSKGAVGGGSFTVLSTDGGSVTGSSMLDTNNNFSNVTLAGNSAFTGWANTEGLSTTDGPNKFIKSNVISNVSGSSGVYLGMSINFAGPSVTVAGNTISGLTTSNATSTGLSIGNSNSSTGTINIYNNKIVNLEKNSASGLLTGLLINGGVTLNIYNNFIGDLRCPLGSNGTTDVVRGIGITSGTGSFINVSNNTIYLNCAAGGTNFTTSALFHTASSGGVANLTAKNNIIINNSIANGTGLAIAFRRSSTTLFNLNAATNKNNFYAGTPSTSHLVFYNGTNSDQTIQDYKARVIPVDSNSFSENTTFKSIVSTTADYLKVDTTIGTQCESNGLVVPGITNDYFGVARYSNADYPVNKYFLPDAPDIGANEFGGIIPDYIASAGSVTLSGRYAHVTLGSGTTGTNLNGAIIYGILTIQGGAGPITGAVTYGINSIINYTGSSLYTTSSELLASVPNVTVNNSGGVILNSGTSITGTLTMTSGNLTLGANNITAASVSGGSSSSYIATTGTGTLTINNVGASDILFPVGNGSYTPVTINNTGTADNFSVNISNSIAHSTLNDNHAVQKQWNISEASAGGSNVKLILQWATANEGNLMGHTGIFIGHWNGSSYEPSSAVFGGTDPAWTATATGLTSFSPFVVSDDIGLPVELSSFTANVDRRNVLLKWSTVSELNNTGFDIERKGAGH